MAVKYSLLYHPLVVSRDIPCLDARWQGRVKKAIISKLTTRPDLFGVPLRQSLKSYRKLRVGDYRIIYRIEGGVVKILIIGHRSDVYTVAEARI